MANVRIDKACGHPEIVWIEPNHPVYTGKLEFLEWYQLERVKTCHDRCGGAKTTGDGRKLRVSKGSTAVAEREEGAVATEEQAAPARRGRKPTQSPDEAKENKKVYAKGYWDGFYGRGFKEDQKDSKVYAKGYTTGERKKALADQGE